MKKYKITFELGQHLLHSMQMVENLVRLELTEFSGTLFILSTYPSQDHYEKEEISTWLQSSHEVPLKINKLCIIYTGLLCLYYF